MSQVAGRLASVMIGDARWVSWPRGRPGEASLADEVLERGPGESLSITAPDGRVIEVTIADLVDGKVSLGIDAPLGYRVARAEPRD
jgi:hypothetical protein